MSASYLQLPFPWVSALVVVRFDDNFGQQIVGQQHAEGDELSLGVQQDIKMLSMPDCLQTSGGGRHSFNFAFRVRDKDCTLEEEPHFQHCFVSFRQCKDASSARGYFQQSVVLVSALPCVGLFYSALDRLAAILLEATPETSIAQTLQTAFQHFAQWPAPPGDSRQGPPLHLPFLGSVLAYNCPSLPVYMPRLRGASSSSSSSSSPPSSSSSPSSGRPAAPRSGLDGGLGSYSDASLLSLQRWGLVPHLWTLWHLVLAGRRIVVYSPSAEVCSAIVLTLCSLTAPLAFAGDSRPYISAADSDVALLAAEGAGGTEGACRLVGITNPFLLRAFKGYDAALFVPDELSSPGSGGSGGGGGMSGAASLFRALALGSGGAAGAAPPSSSSSSGAAVLTARAKVLASGPGARSLEEEHDRWAVKCGGAGGGGGGGVGGGGGGSAGAVAGVISGAVGSLASSLSRGVLGGPRRGARETLLYLRSPPPVAADPDASRRLQSVLGLGGAQAEVIGSMLLREHFRSLTLALLRPLEPLLLQLPPPAAAPQVAVDVAPALAGLTGCLSAARGAAGRPPRASAGAEVVLPPCLCVHDWKALLLALGRSPHFQAWCRWRRQEAREP